MATRTLPRHADTPAQRAFYGHCIACRVDPDYVMLRLARLNGQYQPDDDPRDISPHASRQPRQDRARRQIGPLTHELTARGGRAW